MDELERKLKKINNNIKYYKNDSPLPEEERNNAIQKLEQERDEIEKFLNYCYETNEKINALESRNELPSESKKDLAKLKKELNDRRKDYNKKYQGRYRDVVSSFFGQIDKKIHNLVYKNNSFWRNKYKRVKYRYEHTSKYLLKNVFITIGIMGGLGMASLVVPAIAPYALGASAAFLGQTFVKTIATIRNRARYGGPRLERNYPIMKNGYFKNISNSWNKVLNSNTLSLNDVRSAKRLPIEPEEAKAETSPIANEETDDKDNSLTFMSSYINAIDFNKISEEEIRNIVSFVESNGLENKFSADVKAKYLAIKDLANKLDEARNKPKEDEIDWNVVMDVMNKHLIEADINSLSREQKEQIIKYIEDNKMVDKLSEEAYKKYMAIKNSLIVKQDAPKPADPPVNGPNDDVINKTMTNFQINKASFRELQELIISIDKDNLYEKFTKENKEKYHQIKIIYDVMVKIREFDLNNFDANKAFEIVSIVKSNKILTKLNSEIRIKYQYISKKLDMEYSNEKDNAKNKNDNNSKKEILIKIQKMLKTIDFSKMSQVELKNMIDYIKTNGLENELSDLVNLLNKQYAIKSKNGPSIEDYGNINIGVIGENAASLARYFIQNPPLVLDDMSDDMKNIAILAKKIKDGRASKIDMNQYAMLIYNLTGQEWFQEELMDILGDEYDKYIHDKEEFKGKNAK